MPFGRTRTVVQFVKVTPSAVHLPSPTRSGAAGQEVWPVGAIRSLSRTYACRPSGYAPARTPKFTCRCLRMSRAMRPQALGLYICSSLMVSENTSPMISASISGGVSTRTANFLIRLIGAITASLIGGSRQSSLPTDRVPKCIIPHLGALPPVHQYHDGARIGTGACRATPASRICTDSGLSGFCESWRVSRPREASGHPGPGPSSCSQGEVFTLS